MELRRRYLELDIADLDADAEEIRRTTNRLERTITTVSLTDPAYHVINDQIKVANERADPITEHGRWRKSN